MALYPYGLSRRIRELLLSDLIRIPGLAHMEVGMLAAGKADVIVFADAVTPSTVAASVACWRSVTRRLTG